MSAKENCYDNVYAESFFHSLEMAAIHGEKFATREEMQQTVFGHIEVDYNLIRRHSANGFISRAAFEAKSRLAAATLLVGRIADVVFRCYLPLD